MHSARRTLPEIAGMRKGAKKENPAKIMEKDKKRGVPEGAPLLTDRMSVLPEEERASGNDIRFLIGTIMPFSFLKAVFTDDSQVRVDVMPDHEVQEALRIDPYSSACALQEVSVGLIGAAFTVAGANAGSLTEGVGALGNVTRVGPLIASGVEGVGIKHQRGAEAPAYITGTGQGQAAHANLQTEGATAYIHGG